MKCPACDAPIGPAEITDGWCESCGKRLPAGALREAETESRDQEAARRDLLPGVSKAVADALSIPTAYRRRFLAKVLGGMVAALALNALLAYALAGTVVWVIGGIYLAIIIGGLFFLWLFKPADGLRTMLYLVALLYAVALLGSGMFISFNFARATVYVDNFSPDELRVELLGRENFKCPKNATHTLVLTRGDYTFVVVSADGTELERETVHVAGRGPYILNLRGAETYYRGKVGYGSSAALTTGPTEIKERWFEADVDYLFTYPPKTLWVQGRVSGATRTYLLRERPHSSDER